MIETPANGASANPITTVATTTATMASSRIGAASSSICGTSIVKCRLEEERRQQDVDERVGADRQAREGQRELAEHAARLRVLHDRRKRAERDARAGQQHGGRQRHPRGKPLNEADEHQESGEDEQRDRQKGTCPKTVSFLHERPTLSGRHPRTTPQAQGPGRQGRRAGWRRRVVRHARRRVQQHRGADEARRGQHAVALDGLPDHGRRKADTASAIASSRSKAPTRARRCSRRGRTGGG